MKFSTTDIIIYNNYNIIIQAKIDFPVCCKFAKQNFERIFCQKKIIFKNSS